MNQDHPLEEDDQEQVPERQEHDPSLFVRQGERIVAASAEDQAVARQYPRWPEKGPQLDGIRLTLLTKQTAVHPGEAVRVIHVYEDLQPGRPVYAMGPKPVYGEFVDGRAVTDPPPDPESPFTPAVYDGRVLTSPAVDYNFEISEYRFAEPGAHQVVWKPGKFRSNTLVINIL